VIRAAKSAGRLLLLTLATAFLHLLLLWLWNPRVTVPDPVEVTLARRAPAAPGRGPAELTIVLGGATAPTDAARELIWRHGYEYPFAATLDILREADLALVNLEAPVTFNRDPLPLFKNYSYQIHPAALPAMVWAGVSGVSLANNHLIDYGVQGVLDTLDNLRQARITAFGAGRNAREARRGVVFDLAGTRVGVLSYLEDSFMDAIYVRSFAGPRRPGCARLELSHLEADLARMRRAADVVIVSVHWGRNYTGPTLLQRFYGRRLIESGADLVVGHHPPLHHPVGMHRGRPILYSLGNYAFGTPGHDELRYGLLARLRLAHRRITRVELIPLLVQNSLVNFKPERLVGAEAEAMLQELTRASRSLGASVTVRDGVGVIDLPVSDASPLRR